MIRSRGKEVSARRLKHRVGRPDAHTEGTAEELVVEIETMPVQMHKTIMTQQIIALETTYVRNKQDCANMMLAKFNVPQRN